MTWSKRFLLVLLALCFAASVILTGCGGGDDNPPASDSSGSQVSEPAAKQEGEGDLDAAAIFGKSEGKGFTFDLVITAPGVESVSSQHWLQDDNWRSEVKNPGGEGTLVTIFNAGDEALYFYDPQSNTATRMSSNVDIEDEPVEEYDPANMKYLGRDTVDGKKCVIYEVTEEESTSKVWFWEEHGFPIRVETTVDGQEMVMEYKNVKVGDIPASMFRIPDGVEVMEF